jgi:hypothetical protein
MRGIITAPIRGKITKASARRDGYFFISATISPASLKAWLAFGTPQ